MKKIPLHIRILIGMVLGSMFGIISIQLKLPTSFTLSYIKPIGTIFLNSLKMVAIPLVFSSILVCVVSVQDRAKLSSMGLKALLIYIVTTAISAGVGIQITRLLKPGSYISSQTSAAFVALYNQRDSLGTQKHPQVMDDTPLRFFKTLIPENFFHPFADNEKLLQVVFLAICLGIALLKVVPEKRIAVVTFFEGIYEAMVALIRMIMELAPFGVFALTASLLVECIHMEEGMDVSEIFCALLGYCCTVIVGLAIVLLVVYPIVINMFTAIPFFRFLKELYPVQLLAFSSSSSAVVLPLSIEILQKKLGISGEVSRFILPLGSTLNRNGTALYQAVVCVFVAQVMGIELSFSQQLLLIGNITLSSLGVASAPGAALVVTTVLLQSIDMPAAALALVLPPDRLLDMFRTVVNVTGNALTAVVVGETEQK
ncbi:MAG: dicarboxylate/amino acid:cation symporter [Amoebophilaceae bacterium]|nr:dicarboxylate/amino acid:cation symporter [Amoebophilaceae bacterium]